MFKLYSVLQLEFVYKDRLRAYAWLCLRICLWDCSAHMPPSLFPWEQEIHRRQQPAPVSQQNPNPVRRWEVSGKEERHQSTLQYPPAKKDFATPPLALWWFTSAARGVFHVLINCLQEAFGTLHCHLLPWMHPTEICIPVTCPHLSWWQLLCSALLLLCIPVRQAISA